jgi:amino acid transporter
MHGRPPAGPSIAISFFLVAIACSFAGLCYAELASMIPIAGSAYTYSYATLGEIFAWIIGWDLILEYVVSNVAVAVGFAGYTKRNWRYSASTCRTNGPARSGPEGNGRAHISISPASSSFSFSHCCWCAE